MVTPVIVLFARARSMYETHPGGGRRFEELGPDVHGTESA
jgi:hypothetical protein